VPITGLRLPAHSGGLPISAFCVEQGRSSKRGTEAADQLGSSNAAVAIEALAGRPKAQTTQKAPAISAVQAVLSDAGKAAEKSKQVTGQLTVVKKESAQTLLFETRDRGPEGAWMHRSYVVK